MPNTAQDAALMIYCRECLLNLEKLNGKKKKKFYNFLIIFKELWKNKNLRPSSCQNGIFAMLHGIELNLCGYIEDISS
jgi:hypothetical protein